MTKYQVFGHCNPMIEQIVNVDESFISDAGLGKSGSNLLSLEDYLKVEGLIKQEGAEIIETCAGGSGSNIIAGLSSLGVKTCFFGGIGYDEHGEFLEEEMREKYGVHPILVKKDSPTCTIFTLITPDKERTFAVYLGAAQKLEPNDIPLEALANSEYLMVTGYKVMDSPQTTQALLKAVRENGVKIALDLSCGLHISHARDLFEKVMQDGVHILFANEEETQALYGVEVGSPEQLYTDVVKNNYLKHSDIVAQKRRDKGAIVAIKDKCFRSPAVKIDHIVNFNGAGDGFAIGLIYGLIKYKNLGIAARLANYCASRVIMQIGPRMGFCAEELESIALEYD